MTTSAPPPQELPHPDKLVYLFGPASADGDDSQRNLLGGKGLGLAVMSNLGIPVPPGFTITTEVCTAFYALDRHFPPNWKSSSGRASPTLSAPSASASATPPTPSSSPSAPAPASPCPA